MISCMTSRINKYYLPLAALAAGLLLAFLAAGISSLFFILLPLTAFAFGYMSSWRWGLLNGFLLFLGYTFALSMVWWGINSPNLLVPFPYIAAFIAGGSSLLLIGALAPAVRQGVKRPESVVTLVILAVFTGWCGYTAMPHYSYYYQVALQSSENLSNLELYLPAGTVSGEPYVKLYSEALYMPGDLTTNFTSELVETEQGIMLKINIPQLEKDAVPLPRYTANIIFWYGRDVWQKVIPARLVRLMPQSDVSPVNIVTSRANVGPVKSRESKIIERFNVPVKIIASPQSRIKLTVWNRTDRAEALNFTYSYSKSYPYTERIDYDIQTGNTWQLVPVEATVVMDIRGTGD